MSEAVPWTAIDLHGLRLHLHDRSASVSKQGEMNLSAVGRRNFLATGLELGPGQHDDGEREP
jgi:hypothetical protein